MLRAEWEEDTLAKVHALRPLLRGVKITGFLLAVVSFASFAALQQSRPVGAESFLFQTVQCVLGSVLGKTCESGSAATQLAYSSASGQSSSRSSSGQGQPPQGANQGNGNGKAAPAPPADPQTATDANSFAMPLIDPIEIQSKALNSYAALPDTPLTMADTMQQFQGNSQQVFPYGIRSAASTDAGPVSFVKPSREGWQVLGIAWYWWVLVAVIVMVAVWRVAKVVRRRQGKILLYS